MSRPGSEPGPLTGATESLSRRYDVALLDLDGVVYLGVEPVPGAAAALAEAVSDGMRLGFVTNNASRSQAEVAEQLASVGVPADRNAVVTSAQVAARVLAESLPPDARVLVVGTEALAAVVRANGLHPVRDVDEPVAAVVQGFSPDTGWRELALATRAVRDGALWIATNADPTVPSPHGALPGNGAFVTTVAAASGGVPRITGKPEPSMHRECVRRLRARDPIVVGDRLDTDIEGAARVGCPSLLVFTGVTNPGDLMAAPPEHRPTYLAADLTGLTQPHPSVTRVDDSWLCGGWRVDRGGPLRWTAAAGDPDPWSALRVLCVAAWAGGGTALRLGDADAERAAVTLGLRA